MNSLRGSLAKWSAVVSGCFFLIMLLITGTFFYFAVYRAALADISAKGQCAATIYQRHFASDDDMQRTLRNIGNLINGNIYVYSLSGNELPNASAATSGRYSDFARQAADRHNGEFLGNLPEILISKTIVYAAPVQDSTGKIYSIIVLEVKQYPEIGFAYKIVGCFFVIALIASLLAFYLMRRLGGKLAGYFDSAAKHARIIAAGDYSARLPLSGWNELRQFSVSFNELVETVERNIVEINRQSQLLQQASDRQAAFSANIAHELRTPLAGIYSNSEVIYQFVENIADAKKFAALIRDDAMRMNSLCHNLLLLAKMESADYALQLDKHEVSLSELLKAAVSEKQQRYQDKQHQVSLAIAESIVVFSDSELLRLAADNLVENAFKYAPAGAAITVTADHDAQQTLFFVHNTGTAIPEEKIAKLFDRFFRVEKSRSRKIGGAGLGLALTKQIVEVLGGAISVRSSEADGTFFTVTFPAAAVSNTENSLSTLQGELL
ncbi:MAG: ATP-binding protein [Negativicutes bacterium]